MGARLLDKGKGARLAGNVDNLVVIIESVELGGGALGVRCNNS